MPGVSKEQIQAAREADLFAYLQFHEPGVLKERIAGTRTAEPRRTSPQKPVSKVGLLVDIEAAIRSGKGPGYERWAKVFNLKQLSFVFQRSNTERVAITAGDDLRGLGICHQQAFWQEYRKGIPAKIRNLTEDCIACQ